MVDTMTGHPHGQEHERNEPPPAGLQPDGGEQHDSSTSDLEPVRALRLDSDRDLSRVGFWSLGLGALGVVVGITFLLAGGILPGALVVGVAGICAVIGALALALVAHHQG